MLRPRVTADRRHFELSDGTPFFWLGDTAWELFHRLTKDETDQYLKIRAEQGFTVIQAVALAEFDGLKSPNAEGQLPLVDLDPTRPNEAYWKHVDWAIDRAAHYGLYMGLLPTWGDKVNHAWGIGPIVFDEAKAHAYGRFVGHRYVNRDNVIWINGGDRDPADRIAVWRALAKELREGDDSHERLMSYHPQGERSSSFDFHYDDWLDFNMIQSGHASYDPARVERLIRGDYAKSLPKPVIDAEPNYENHPINWNKTRGYYDDGCVRTATYTGLFCGAAGVTYGCQAVWQFACDRFDPIADPISHWHYSIRLSGARQMRHLKELMLSIGYQSLSPLEGAPHLTLARNGKAVAVYAPKGETVGLSEAASAKWFDPTNGEWRDAGAGPSFSPPKREGKWQDWVLVVGP